MVVYAANGTPRAWSAATRSPNTTPTNGAASASVDDATSLGVAAGSPVLHCERITTDTTGRPVLMSEHVFPAHRTEFVVELPNAGPSTTPSGLRLVE